MDWLDKLFPRRNDPPTIEQDLRELVVRWEAKGLTPQLIAAHLMALAGDLDRRQAPPVRPSQGA
jgi:hypothetical protein